MRALVGAPVDADNITGNRSYFVNLYVTADAVTVTLFYPCGETGGIALGDDEAAAYLNSHSADSFSSEHAVISANSLKDGLATVAAVWESRGKRTLFTDSPVGPRTDDWYGASEFTDRSNFAWVFKSPAGELEMPRNRVLDTVITKAGTRRYLHTISRSIVAQLIAPFGGEPLDSEFNSLMFLYNKDIGYRCNLPVTELTQTQLHDHTGGWAPMANIAITGEDCVKAGELVDLHLKLGWEDGTDLKYPATVFLETTAGYLPKRRITLNANGEGAFKVRATDLVAGDSFKIKVGWKHYSGVCEHLLTVL